jgi:hypothetical protein
LNPNFATEQIISISKAMAPTAAQAAQYRAKLVTHLEGLLNDARFKDMFQRPDLWKARADTLRGRISSIVEFVDD